MTQQLSQFKHNHCKGGSIGFSEVSRNWSSVAIDLERQHQWMNHYQLALTLFGIHHSPSLAVGKQSPSSIESQARATYVLRDNCPVDSKLLITSPKSPQAIIISQRYLHKLMHKQGTASSCTNDQPIYCLASEVCIAYCTLIQHKQAYFMTTGYWLKYDYWLSLFIIFLTITYSVYTCIYF